MEIDFGDWEMKLFDEIDDPNLQRWYGDYVNVRATNGESFADQYRRVSAFLQEVRHREERNTVVFAHGGVLKCAQIYAGMVRPEEAFNEITPYGGMVRLEF